MPTENEFSKPSQVTQSDFGQEKTERPLTFGEKAVGITFNPGGNPIVDSIKQKAASYIDLLNEQRDATPNGEVKRMLSIAITEAQTSQMWAVKSVTWKYDNLLT